MTPLLQSRRRAEDFAAAVDGHGGGRHARSDEVRGLLELVGALREQAPVQPREGFSSDLRTRLMVEARTALTPETAGLLLPVREPGRRERRLVAAASAFVLIGGTTTMAAAAQSALPGDALYPLKRGIERAEVSLSISPAGKGRDLLSQATDRLVEVEGLLVAGTVTGEPRVSPTLDEFSAAADEGSSLLFESFRQTADPETIRTVRTFTAEGLARLTVLAPDVPSDAQDELAAAALLLGEIDDEAAGLCHTCAGDLPALEVPGIFLARVEVDRALSLAAVRDLNNDHPVVVNKDAVRAVRQATEAEPASAPGGEPTPEATPAPAPVPGPAPAPEPGPVLPGPTPWAPEPLPSVLPGTETDGGTTTTNDPSVVDPATGGVLTGAVETLLPDPDGTLLD